MALRVSKPQTTPARPGAGTAELPARAQALVAHGDLAGYRALFAQAAEEPDAHRRYTARKELLQAGLTAPRGSMQAVSQTFLAVAVEGLAILADEPREPVLLNAVGIALYELGALSGAKALFEAAHRLDPQLPHVEGNIREIARRRRQNVAPKVPAAIMATLRGVEADAKRTALRAKPVEGLTLSLCMIVRDEEAMLPRCLDAVAGAVDEIVIVDTGSSDATMDIARSYGAKVLETEWTGDFAAARNVSFEAATSDWIVYLDADEVLSEGQAERLRELTGRTWREAFFLVEHNHTGALEDGTSVHHNALRVFRNRAEYRFEGRIHEQIAHRLPADPERLEQTDIRMEHFGYLGVVREEKDKSRRNLELLEAQLAEGIDTPFLHFNLGSEHAALGQAAPALEHFEQAWAKVRAGGEDIRKLGYVPSLVSRLGTTLRVQGERERLERHVDEALAIFPGFTDLVLDQALAALHADDLDRAAALLERCLEMGDAPSAYSATVGSGTFIAQGLLGEAHRRAGRLEEAEEVLRAAFATNPRFLGAVEPLAQLLLARGLPGADVAAAVHELVAEDTPSLRFLLAVPLYEAGEAEAAEAELRGVLARQPHAAAARVALAEALLSQKRYADAAAEAAQVGTDSPSAPAAAQAELFGRLAAGETDLDDTFARARAAGLDADAVALFDAWRALAAGGEPPAVLGTATGELLLVVMEALLRVQDIDPFVALLPLADRLPLAARQRRERLAQLYFRRGFVDSAADEWAAACEEQGPDADALAGLAAVAVVREQPEDGHLFASTALELQPGHPGALRVLERLGRL